MSQPNSDITVANADRPARNPPAPPAPAVPAVPAAGRPLHVAVLVKQVPKTEFLQLGADGRLCRERVPLEMNPFCRRAVSKGVELARDSGGSCTVITLGPPPADDVLREAIAWGANAGIHICDETFAGSDTLATARALAAALAQGGPFDLVLVGRNSVDGETGQVGPQVAQLSGLAYASSVRELTIDDGRLDLDLELDDGSQHVQLDLPALLSVAERLCQPCKVPPPRREQVPAGLIRRISAQELGDGPWGQAGSPTRVGAVRAITTRRIPLVLTGPIDEQVREAVQLLAEREALWPRVDEPTPDDEGQRESRLPASQDRIVAVLLEPGRPDVGAELLGAAGRIADQLHGTVVALAGVTGGVLLPGEHTRPDLLDPASLPELSALAGSFGADELVVLGGASTAEDIADGVISWARRARPWAVLAPGTAFGREVAGRASAALDAGLVGDAVGLDLLDGDLVAAKPFAGAFMADISYTSPVRMVTVRPGVLTPARRSARPARYVITEVPARGRVTSVAAHREDNVEILARAHAVVGVGVAVPPDEYEPVVRLAAALGAELAATRKVADRGWQPRARQLGVTGRSIAPRLYVAVAMSGSFNHMIGVRAAEHILAINSDPAAPVFEHADIGIVGDWREVLPVLADEVTRVLGRGPSAMATH
jgi:electron transfer flavoprotein alpha subunit